MRARRARARGLRRVEQGLRVDDGSGTTTRGRRDAGRVREQPLRLAAHVEEQPHFRRDEPEGRQPQKEKLKQSATTVPDANKQLADDLRALGTPRRSAGRRRRRRSNTLSNELQSSADQIEKAAKDVTTTQDGLAAWAP